MQIEKRKSSCILDSRLDPDTHISPIHPCRPKNTLHTYISTVICGCGEGSRVWHAATCHYANASTSQDGVKMLRRSHLLYVQNCEVIMAWCTYDRQVLLGTTHFLPIGYGSAPVLSVRPNLLRMTYFSPFGYGSVPVSVCPRDDTTFLAQKVTMKGECLGHVTVTHISCQSI